MTRLLLRWKRFLSSWLVIEPWCRECGRAHEVLAYWPGDNGASRIEGCPACAGLALARKGEPG